MLFLEGQEMEREERGGREKGRENEREEILMDRREEADTMLYYNRETDKRPIST